MRDVLAGGQGVGGAPRADARAVMWWTEPRIALLRTLAAQGRTRRQAAAEMEITTGKVAGACYRYEIQFGSSPGGPLSGLAREIAAARVEAETAPPYRSSVGWPA